MKNVLIFTSPFIAAILISLIIACLIASPLIFAGWLIWFIKAEKDKKDKALAVKLLETLKNDPTSKFYKAKV